MTEQSPLVSTDLLQVRHVTRYRYARAVAFGQHRAMFRPHESNDLRLTSFEINTHPASAHHWVHDVFSNSKVILDFQSAAPSDTLEIVCEFSVVRSTVHEPKFPITDFARRYPFAYSAEHWPDLVALIRPEYDSPEVEVRNWAQQFVDRAGGDSWTILENINRAIHTDFDYQRREEPGIQVPRETLAAGVGSCRDFAVLMLEAVRQLGFAARFVTGYLYDPLTDRTDEEGRHSLQGAGSTHAWVQIFLPGAGWIEFDPTNGLIASGQLIRTGVARLPAQAVPLQGSFEGAKDDFLSMDVSVDVKALAPTISS